MEQCLIGIDFGTCNIKVANYNEARKKTMLLKLDKNQNNGDKKIPNVIEYSAKDKFYVGDRAKKRTDFNGNNIISHIKRKLEYDNWQHEFKELGFACSAEEVAQDIFSWLKMSIESLGREIKESVVTVPVCFSEIQKNRIIAAAKNAGIPVVDTLTEPVAALFCIEELFEEEECEENVVVFDFGGATLDICLFHIENDGEGEISVNIESSVGIDFGGVDITNIIYDKIIYPKYKEYFDKQLKNDTLNQVKKVLIDTVEDMKYELFNDEEEMTEGVYVSPIDGEFFEMELELADVIKQLEAVNIKERILQALDDLFEDSNYEKANVSMVKTFGGTSRILYFREILENYFGDDVFDIDDYDSELAYSAVADGAAQYLSIRYNDESDIQVTNAIPFYIGWDEQGTFKTLVKRNQKYGVMSPYRNIDREELEKRNWHIELYQAFNCEDVKIKGEDGAVYMGEIELDSALYNEADTILYKFGVNRKGVIVGQFSITDKDNNIQLVEEKVIQIGG